MEADTIEIIKIVIAALLGGFVPSALSLLFGRRKAKAEETDIITQAAERAVKMQQEQIDDMIATISRQAGEIVKLNEEYKKLRADHDALSKEFDELIAGANILREQLESAKLTPLYIPPERRKRK